MFLIPKSKSLKFILIILSLVFFVNVILLQSKTLLIPSSAITPSETQLASKVVKTMMGKLASHHAFIDVDIKQDELAAVAKMGSHLLPKTDVLITTSRVGVLLVSSTQVALPFNRYLNLTCMVTRTIKSAELQDCKIGHLPIPGGLVKWVILTAFSMVMGDELSETANELLANIQYSEQGIKSTAQKSKNLKEQVNASMSNIGDIATLYQQNTSVDIGIIQQYIDELDKINAAEFHQPLQQLFALAQQRSVDNDPVEENTAIIWALAIKYGDYRFASLMGIKRKKGQASIPELRGRTDLTQHFIYSAALQQLSDLDIGLSIGEAKEVLDSLSGGSGFSFADLAADKAGLKFADFITSSNHNALQAQNQLAGMNNEDDFFPFIHDLPEGFKDSNYKRVISSIESENYAYIASEIDRRINSLTLYKQATVLQTTEDWPQANKVAYRKSWYKVDTHIHSKFSDGSNTIDEIAEQAANFGCEAIAITDHGDHNLKGVVSDEYFQAINTAQVKHPSMTIMPGLEWNIPPFNGREHVTVILPETTNQVRNLKAFRDRFDQFKRFDEKVISPEQAFKWLNKHGADQSLTQPLVIYNHPSRKDFQQRENQHDFTYWREFSDLVVGFSGAPGHQKKRGADNGSYSTHLKTINGWDPSVENIGGEWDRLLQQGYKIWAARAASDFHNSKMDYWPCQFSSTHVQSKSNEQNDILQSFQSGSFWAQHGNFVQNLAFSVSANKNQAAMGESMQVEIDELVHINIEVALNYLDWQSMPTTLDELELVIITEQKIDSIIIDDLKMTGNKVVVAYPYLVNTNSVIFRLRGRSIQPEQHNYMFYSNPIKLVTH